jgi:hypothetical protein
VTPESHDTLIAAAAYVTNSKARVDTVDDDDELDHLPLGELKK